MVLPAFVHNLPEFVKTVGRSLLPELSQSRGLRSSAGIISALFPYVLASLPISHLFPLFFLPMKVNIFVVLEATRLINSFSKMSYLTERQGLSDRFFMLLLSLSMCLSCIFFDLPLMIYFFLVLLTYEDRSSEYDSHSGDRKLLERLSRKVCILHFSFFFFPFSIFMLSLAKTNLIIYIQNFGTISIKNSGAVFGEASCEVVEPLSFSGHLLVRSSGRCNPLLSQQKCPSVSLPLLDIPFSSPLLFLSSISFT